MKQNQQPKKDIIFDKKDWEELRRRLKEKYEKKNKNNNWLLAVNIARNNTVDVYNTTF